ncbi:MAG: ABC transporter ATP-binding protein [Alphaproteobacteria bacterium]|nr:ABC transporter ATP-binding protein [Alphaproteobacteria bacterium]
MELSVSIKDLSVAYGVVKVLEGLDLDIGKGEFIVLLGPSGCGKSTLLNCIAGLLDVSGGQVIIEGKNVTWEEPKDRGIGMVFQSYALYPQMSVERNLSFGLRVSGMKRDEIDKRVARAAEILQIEPLMARKPAHLSGGQRQRVAIGRALVRDVDVFLFDEPLSNLDAKLRSDLRVEIKRLHQRLKNTMIYVTHDQIEAMTLADRIAVMKDGVIQQLDTPHGVYHRPVNHFVAGFIGSPTMNFMEGDLSGTGSDAVIQLEGLKVPMKGYEFAEGGAVAGAGKAILGVRPEHVLVGKAAANMPVTVEIEVEIVEPMGADVVAWTQVAGKSFTFRTDSEILLKPGDKVTIGFDPARASLFDQKTGHRL